MDAIGSAGLGCYTAAFEGKPEGDLTSSPHEQGVLWPKMLSAFRRYLSPPNAPVVEAIPARPAPPESEPAPPADSGPDPLAGLAPELAATLRGDAEALRVVGRLREIAASKGPVMVGPWLSEVGYEILYWIPFLNWAVREFKIDRRRLKIVSRGGVAAWYSGLSTQYSDLFDIFTPDEFRVLNEERWKETSIQKHMIVSSFDRAVIQKLGLDESVSILHPELMYRLFEAYWSGGAGFDRFQRCTLFKPMEKPKPDFLSELPEKYLAVKFYSRPSMPADAATAAFVDGFTRALAETMPVVYLNTAISADDHGEFPLPDHPNIYPITKYLTPTNNLLVQSAIVANAEQVYCTYGGFAYLPLLYKVPTCGFFSVDKHFMKIHGRAAYLLSNKMGVALTVSDIDWVSRLSRMVAAGPARAL